MSLPSGNPLHIWAWFAIFNQLARQNNPAA